MHSCVCGPPGQFFRYLCTPCGHLSPSVLICLSTSVLICHSVAHLNPSNPVFSIRSLALYSPCLRGMGLIPGLGHYAAAVGRECLPRERGQWRGHFMHWVLCSQTCTGVKISPPRGWTQIMGLTTHLCPSPVWRLSTDTSNSPQVRG